MTFQQRTDRRWRVSAVFAVAGFLLTLALTWVLMFFALFVAIDLEQGQRTLVLTIVLFLVGATYLIGWTFRGLFVGNIDVLVRDMGPLQREVLAAAIREELNQDSAMASVRPPKLTTR